MKRKVTDAQAIVSGRLLTLSDSRLVFGQSHSAEAKKLWDLIRLGERATMQSH